MDSFHSRRELRSEVILLDEKVDFYFDDQSEKSLVFSAWDDYLANRPDDIRKYYGVTPHFEDDQEFLPLQAADLWAWWVRKWYEEDNVLVPDKMKAFDFGKWRGQKKRPCSTFYADEDGIVDLLFKLAFSHIEQPED